MSNLVFQRERDVWKSTFSGSPIFIIDANKQSAYESIGKSNKYKSNAMSPTKTSFPCELLSRQQLRVSNYFSSIMT